MFMLNPVLTLVLEVSVSFAVLYTNIDDKIETFKILKPADRRTEL